MSITLTPIGHVSPDQIRSLARFLCGSTGMTFPVRSEVIDPEFAYNDVRGQYNCRELLPVLDALADTLKTQVLGVADVDLYSPIFTFVLGETRLGGDTGLFSLHRLHPTLYGLPDDPELFEARAHKEALHETGHLLGLVHCRIPHCVMRFSSAVEEVDLKSDTFCSVCAGRLELERRGVAGEKKT